MVVISPPKGNIIVSVNLNQKDEAIIGGGNVLKTGKAYNENFRERNPVVAKVEVGNKEIPKGSYIVCNYSYFDLESPLFMFDNLYSIPVNEEIYAMVNQDGSLTPVCGNVLVDSFIKQSILELPSELLKPCIDRGTALTGEYKDHTIFWLKYSNYEIVYQWNLEEKRAIKIHNTEITGYIKK